MGASQPQSNTPNRRGRSRTPVVIAYCGLFGGLATLVAGLISYTPLLIEKGYFPKLDRPLVVAILMFLLGALSFRLAFTAISFSHARRKTLTDGLRVLLFWLAIFALLVGVVASIGFLVMLVPAHVTLSFGASPASPALQIASTWFVESVAGAIALGHVIGWPIVAALASAGSLVAACMTVYLGPRIAACVLLASLCMTGIFAMAQAADWAGTLFEKDCCPVSESISRTNATVFGAAAFYYYEVPGESPYLLAGRSFWLMPGHIDVGQSQHGWVVQGYKSFNGLAVNPHADHWWLNSGWLVSGTTESVYTKRQVPVDSGSWSVELRLTGGQRHWVPDSGTYWTIYFMNGQDGYYALGMILLAMILALVLTTKALRGHRWALAIKRIRPFRLQVLACLAALEAIAERARLAGALLVGSPPRQFSVIPT